MQRRGALKKLFASVFGLFAVGSVSVSTDSRVKMKKVNDCDVYYLELPAEEAVRRLPELSRQVFSNKLKWYSFSWRGDKSLLEWSSQDKKPTGWRITVTYEYNDPSPYFDSIRGKIQTYTQMFQDEKSADDFLESWDLKSNNRIIPYKVLNKTKKRVYEECEL